MILKSIGDQYANISWKHTALWHFGKREVGFMRAKSKSPDINNVATFVVSAAAEANDPVYVLWIAVIAVISRHSWAQIFLCG